MKINKQTKKFQELLVEKTSYYLFISVDIVGSTNIKDINKEYRNSVIWKDSIEHFYEKFIPEFNEQLKIHKEYKEYKFIIDKNPIIWKYIGDEILFKMKITEYESVSYAIRSLTKAIKNYVTNTFKDNEKFEDLDLKATAWSAGFPVNNIIAQTRIEIDEKLIVIDDYVGPSIDTGFRISKNSNKYKFIIGHSVALFLLESDTSSELNICFNGLIKLDGISEEYPFIYIPMDNKSSNKKIDDLINQKSSNSDALKSYLLESKKKKKPFLSNCSKFDDIDNKYKEYFENTYNRTINTKDMSGNNKDIDSEVISRQINKTNIT